jgi:molybdate transport system substrate-binding protein
MRTRATLVLAAAVAAALALTGTACSSSPAEGDDSASSTDSITVAAAASLTDVFETIGAEFTSATGVEVRFSYAASSAIAEQIRGGAPLDVFASAGPTAMAPLVAEQLVSGVVDFATNSLTIAVPVGNPGGVTGLADLTRVSVVVCQEQVPCGVATVKLFERNALSVSPVSFEPDVRSVLTKIETDEADAGLVYVTDVAAAGSRVEAVAIPADANVTTTYQAAVVTESGTAEAAAFVAFLTGPEAQAALAAAGFGPTS